MRPFRPGRAERAHRVFADAARPPQSSRPVRSAESPGYAPRVAEMGFLKVPTTFLKSRPLPCFSNMAGGYFLEICGDVQAFAVILERESHIS